VDEQDAEFLEKHADELTRFATAVVGPSEAPDVVSGAFLHCVVSGRWPTVSDRRAYLYRAVLNEALATRRSLARRRQRDRHAVLAEPVSDDLPSHEVLDAVRRLSVRQRAVVVLTYWQDLVPASVAALLGISEGAVRRHLARARAHLKEYLDDQA
jgi:RNA polymerase sigma-70 factor (ECF subfamily)